MYCCQNTTQYPVNRTKNHMNRLMPASTTIRRATQIHQGTLNGQRNVASFSNPAIPIAGRTSHAFPTTKQKLRTTVPIDGGGASASLRGSRKKTKTTKNIRKTLSAATR